MENIVPTTDTSKINKPVVEIIRPWTLVLFNDEIHTFDEVIDQLIKATKCTRQQAEGYTCQVHFEGKAVVLQGDFTTCFGAESVLNEIKLRTELRG